MAATGAANNSTLPAAQPPAWDGLLRHGCDLIMLLAVTKITYKLPTAKLICKYGCADVLPNVYALPRRGTMPQPRAEAARTISEIAVVADRPNRH